MNFTVPPSSFSSFLCYWDFVSLITPLTSSTIQILIQELSIYGSYSCTIYNSTRQYGSFNFEIWTFFFGLFHKSFLSGFFHSNRFGGSLFLVSLSQLPLSAWMNYLIIYCCVVLTYTEFNIFKGKVFPRYIFFKNQSLGRRLNIWSWQSLLWWLWMHTYL